MRHKYFITIKEVISVRVSKIKLVIKYKTLSTEKVVNSTKKIICSMHAVAQSH